MRIFYFIIFSFVIGSYFSQSSCNNEDFESSPAGAVTVSTSVSGWTVTGGSNPFFGGSCTHSVCCTGNPNAASIINAGAGYIDPNIGSSYPIYSVFGSVPNPGGTFGGNIIMINDNIANGSAQKISKSINVTVSNYYLQFAFISVLAGGHSCCDAPSVSFRLLDPTGGNTVIPCPQYTASVPGASCTQTLANLTYSTCPLNGLFSYNKWKTVGFDLSTFIGTTVTFEAIANDCTQGNHQGYMYFDAQCGPMGINLNGSTFYFPSAGNSVNLPVCGASYAIVTAPPGFDPYLWINGSFQYTYTPPSPTFSTQFTGTYTLQMGGFGSCPIINKYGTVNAVPGANVGVMSSNSIICSGSSATLTGNAANSYSWSTGSTNTTIVVSPTASTMYTLTGYNNYSCTATTTIGITVATCTSIDEIPFGDNFAIYPQPAQDLVSILLSNFYEPIIQIKITDVNGKEILNKEFQVSNFKTIIQTQQLPRGVYILHLKTKEGQFAFKRLIISN